MRGHGGDGGLLRGLPDRLGAEGCLRAWRKGGVLMAQVGEDDFCQISVETSGSHFLPKCPHLLLTKNKYLIDHDFYHIKL